MNERIDDIEQNDEELLAYNVTDDALEAASGARSHAQSFDYFTCQGAYSGTACC